MNMPGFTAEASLYKPSERYKMVGTLATLAGSAEVVPQAFDDVGCMQWCLWGGSTFWQCWYYCGFLRNP